VVFIGQAGLTDGVVAEVDRALTAHELIKVRIDASDRAERAWIAQAICERTDAATVQSVGKVVSLWRPRPDEAADE
jgi:RNA-binding protein